MSGSGNKVEKQPQTDVIYGVFHWKCRTCDGVESRNIVVDD